MSTYCLTPIYQCKLVREGSAKTATKVKSSAQAKAVAVEMLKDSPCEKMLAILLDTKLKVIGAAVVGVGVLDAALVHPREFFRPAILSNASAIVSVHNHPSGDLTPSSQDVDVHKRLVKCGELLGIQVVDSIIVNSDGEAYSINESGPF